MKKRQALFILTITLFCIISSTAMAVENIDKTYPAYGFLALGPILPEKVNIHLNMMVTKSSILLHLGVYLTNPK